MAHCYLLAVSQGSVLDHYTNNWTLFGLTTRVGIPPDAPAAAGDVLMPFELHAHWEFGPDEMGGEFEWRFLMTTGDRTSTSAPYQLRTEKRFHRHRIRGFPLLLEGDTRIMAEWRMQHGEWNRCALSWPLILERQQAVAPPAQGGA